MNHRFLKLGALMLGATVVPGAIAQVKADGQWRGLGGASLSINSGNTDSRALLLNVNMARATETDKITLGGTVKYAKSEDAAGVSQTTANKWAANGQYDYNLTPRVFVFGKLGLEADRLIQLSLRTSLASGAGYHLVQTPDTTFDVFGGLAYITDKYRV